jgi:hypothetical protein
MNLFTKDFEDFIGCLNANGVRYLVVGGMAVIYHGYPRYTGDIDFWIEKSPDNAGKIMKAIQDFGMGSLNLGIDDFLKKDNIIQLGFEPNRIDILTDLHTGEFERCYAQKKEEKIKNLVVPFIDISDLIASKLVANRPQDIADVYKLQKVMQKRKTK